MSLGWIEARSWAESQAQTWFLADDPPLTVGGVEIGWPLQVDAFDAFLRVAVQAAGVTADAHSFSVARTAKRFGVDRALRANAMRPLGGTPQAPPQPAAAMFVSEVPTPSMLEPSLRVAAQLPREKVAVAAADPRALRRWRRAGFDAAALLLPWREERRMVATGRRQAAQAWDAFVARRPSFAFGNQNVTEAVMRELRWLIRNSTPWLAVELLALQRMIKVRRPASVVVATDQHRIGRLAVTACEGTSANVVVLQHGLPQTPIAFLPLVANQIYVWSEGVRSWFIRHGTQASQVIVVGNPRIDDLMQSDRDTLRAGVDADHGLAATRRLLVPLSPLGMDANLAVLRIVIDAARADPDLVSVVKLHPGSGDSRPIRQRIGDAGLGRRISILQHEPLMPLLLWADVTFLFRSTVALESIAARTPVVVAEYGPVSIADDELAALALPKAASGRDLADHVKRLSVQSERETYLAQRGDEAQEMTGPLDGRASARIASLLMEADASRGGGS